MMLSDGCHDEIVKVSNADEIEATKQHGQAGFLTTAEHLGIGKQLQYADVLYNAGVRLAGLTAGARTIGEHA